MLFNYKAGLKETFNRKGSYLPGQIAKSGWRFVETLNSLNTLPRIEFGTVIKRITEPNKVPYASPIGIHENYKNFYGVAVRDVVSQSDINYSGDNANFVTSYFAGQPISVMRKGYITVPVQNGTPHTGGQVYIRVEESTTNPNLPIGGVEALATEGTIAWKNVFFESGPYFPTKGTTTTPDNNTETSQCATIFLDEAQYGVDGLEVTSPNDITAVYGTYLNTINLQGGTATYNGEDVPGRFVINNGDEVIPVGEYSLSATFIPNDPVYERVTNVPIKVTITPATPTVTTAPVTNKDLYYGDGLFELSLIRGRANVPGQFVWEEPNTRPQRTSTQLAKFVPLDSHNYTEVGNVNVTVNIIQVPISAEVLPTASSISAGSALSTSQLTGGNVVETRDETHNVTGTWSWSQPDTVVNQTGRYVAIFVPENNAKYGDLPLEIMVTVN